MEEALKELEIVAQCSFSYGADILPLRKRVSITIRNESVNKALDEILGVKAFLYKLLNNQIIIYRPNSRLASEKYILNGYVKDAQTGETLIGATVWIPEIAGMISTNTYGFYSISLFEGTYALDYSYQGYQHSIQKVTLNKDLQLNVSLLSTTKELDEVIITADNKGEEQRDQTGLLTLSNENIKSMPALAGEADVIKAIQMLPGVKTIGEGSSGFFVRGGGLDQNLIWLDEAPVYNPSHLLGFFSTFNPDAIKEAKLYSGNIPAQFGGRLSSLLDIRMKDGNAKEWLTSGGIGLISSRLTVEGPIVNDKSSMIISLRRSYADLLLPLLDNPQLTDTRLYFYDINAKFNYTLNNKNRLFISGYTGRDLFDENKNFKIGWGNRTATLRWNHLFTNKLFSNFTLLYSNFNYKLGIENSDSTSSNWTSKVNDINFKTDFTLFANPSNTIKFGINTIFHSFDPGKMQSNTGNGNSSVGIPESFAIEHGIYLSNQQQFGEKLSVEYGLRYSILQNIGKAIVYKYNSGHELIDSIFYKSGDIYHTYSGIEPRLSIRLSLDQGSSFKASYNRMRQYLQLISNSSTSFSSPDIWVPSGPNIKPQFSDQYTLGYNRNIESQKNSYVVSVEAYYKHMSNQLDYKDHAQLSLNPYLEGELRVGNAWSYGLEWLLKKQSGRFNGWISYTWSQTKRKIPGINNGNAYPARYDKPHAFSVVTQYQASYRLNLSANWIYTSGEAVTLPIGIFQYEGRDIPVYSDRNAKRFPTYHRLDLSATLQPKIKSGRKNDSSWTFSLYNAYSRKNVFAINFNRQVDQFGNIISTPPLAGGNNIFPTHTATTKTYIFSIVPSVTYNFKFSNKSSK